MVKKIRKNSSYSYNDRDVKPTSVTSNIDIESKEPILDVDSENASLIRRLGAYVIDLMIYLPIALVFQYTTATLRAQGGAENERNALYMTLSIVIFAILLYGYLPHKWQGKTVGKQIFKIRVVPTNNRKIDFSKYLVREFLVKVGVGLFVVPVVVVYWLYQKFVKKEQNPVFLHDYLMNTRVVVAKEDEMKKIKK